MRSVVVVLPASMCAMMPMLRTLLRSVVMSTATESLFLRGRYLGCERRTPTRGAVFPSQRSPAVVGEGLVGLGHLVGVLALLHSGTEAVGGVEDLVHQALGHRLLPTVRGVPDQPPQRERRAACSLDLDRDLVRRATDAAGLHLDRRLHVVHGALQRDHGVGAGLV